MKAPAAGRVHFVTGKGGVGKSTVAAALTMALSKRNEGPVLLVDVQGSGRALTALGLEKPSFEIHALKNTTNAFGCRIFPRETFKQYFKHLLTLGKEHSALAVATENLRSRLVDVIFENRIASAFVDACPGLEPSVLLGKLHFEATSGLSPEEEIPWAHVVVDAPSTGHGLMLFRSTFALIDVFGKGIIFNQAQQMRDFFKDPSKIYLYVVSTLEELPLQESTEMIAALGNLNLPVRGVILNRCPPTSYAPAPESANTPENVGDPWGHEARLQREIWDDQSSLMKAFRAQVPKTLSITEIPELQATSTAELIAPIANCLRHLG